ncbi:hypothetical protein NWQ33_04825 [Mycoplasmopsis cynos]|nr:hypothetical protein [Mycoplasmopsis cynos]
MEKLIIIKQKMIKDIHVKDMKWLVEKLDKLKEEYKKAEKEATKSQTSASR